MKIFEIKKADRKLYQSQIEDLETSAEYPLGDDFFKISHGKDYFKFFDRLGTVHYFACSSHNKIVAVACGIIRNLETPIFYLCDLKVHPDYRGQHIPLKILLKAAFRYYLKCPRGYAISMDHKNQRENKVAKLLKKFWILPFKVSAKIYIYSFTYVQILELRKIIELEKGLIAFLSLENTKDLILRSTKSPIPLVHIQYGSTGDYSVKEPSKNSVHMLSLLESDVLVRKFLEINVFPESTASLITHNLKNTNFNFILTSDI